MVTQPTRQPGPVLRLDTQTQELIEAEWRPAVEFMMDGTIVEFRLKNLGDVRRWPSGELLAMNETAAKIAKINPRNEKAAMGALADAPGIVQTAFYDEVPVDLLAQQPPGRLLEITEYFRDWLASQIAEEAEASDAEKSDAGVSAAETPG